MISPDDEDKAFVARWNTLVAVLIVEPSVKLVARTAVDYGVADGEGVYPGNERLARETSLTERAVREAWKVLRALDMAEVDDPSHWNGRRRTADSYSLVIPDDWRSKPIFGPGRGRFICQHCGKKYNPRPGTVVHDDGSVGWYVSRMVFCPPPGRPKRTRKTGPLKPAPPSCFDLWLGGHPKGWPKGGEAWDMFRKARNDDWP
jgi:hypothetical protein